MNIRRFRSENLAFEETPGIVTQGRVGQFLPISPRGESHIKVKGMLVRKLKI